MKRIVYSDQALHALRRMDRATARRIVGKIGQLATDPESLANNIKRLTGKERELLRLRVGDWRILFTMTLEIVGISRISPRSSAYE